MIHVCVWSEEGYGRSGLHVVREEECVLSLIVKGKRMDFQKFVET